MKNRLLILLNLLVLLGLLSWISYQRTGRVFGKTCTPSVATTKSAAETNPHLPEVKKFLPQAAELTPDGLVCAASGEVLGRYRLTLPCAPDVVGYGGPIPLLLVLDTQKKLLGIAILPNEETPGFLKRVLKTNLLQKWIGQTADSGVKVPVDAVSGATLSSSAIIKSVRAGLAAECQAPPVPEPEKFQLNLRQIAGLVAILGALLCAFFKVKNRRIRQLQLFANAVLLGVVSGSFISLSGVLTQISGGVNFFSGSLVPLLLLIAIIFPLFFGRKIYCLWFCPLGSAQELLGQVQHRKKLKTPLFLNRSRATIGTALLVLWSFGMGWIVLDFELFPGLLWGSVPWALRIGAAVILLLAIFVPRPYCRFLCPTGLLLDFLATPRHVIKKNAKKPTSTKPQ